MHTSNVWFVALCYALILKLCATHNDLQRFKAKASLQGQEPLGKSWGWKKQSPPPQNNFIIITRPALTPALPLSPATLPTSPVSVTSTFTTPTTAQVVVRQGNYRNKNRSNRRNVNRYRNRLRNRNGNGNRSRGRRRPMGTGVYYAREDNDDKDNDDVNADYGDNTSGSEEKGNSEGVNSKLDIEQLEKSLSPHENHNKFKHINANNKHDDDLDATAVSVEAADEAKGSKTHRRRISKPQATASFLPTAPTALSIVPIITTRTSKLPTYAMAAITNGHFNNNSNKDDESGGDDYDDAANNNRQTIWQSLTKRWRDLRNSRRKESNNDNNNNKKQQLQKIKGEEEMDKHEIIIDENGNIHIQKQHKKQNNNKKINRQEQKQHRIEFENEVPAAAVAVAEEEKEEQQEANAMNSLINDINTNSRLQNIINAFRLRTPIIYKKQR